MISFTQFRDKYNNKPIDWDGYYGAQCMDLMHFYIVEVLGLSGNILAAPTAYQAYVNGDPNFEKIANTPTGVPQNGDIMFWNTTVGSAGHVAVFMDGDVNKFNSFDQNWPVGSVCHVQSHDYKGVAGWLRFKKLAETVVVDKATFEKLVSNSSKFDAFVAAGFPDVSSVKTKVLQLEGEVSKRQMKLDQIKTIVNG